MPDAAVPAVISPSVYGTTFYVLNQDMTSLAHSTASSYHVTCPAPAAATSPSSLPKALANDTQNGYVVGPDANSTDALTGLLFGSSTCHTTASSTLQGAAPAQAFIANDEFHGRAFTLNASSSGDPDILTQYSNLSTGTGDSISRTSRTSLDSGAQYTSLLVDGRGQYGLVIATERKTGTSPGNLWVYSPGISTAFKILDPAGNPLPASNAFIVPAVNDGGGDLLILVNQDNLTAANLASAPQDTVPFTIIDLGQLQRTFSAVVASGNTVTLPFVKQIKATQNYAAMLGAVYDPVSRLLYAVVGSGSNSASSLLSYNPYTPDTPNETVVGDVSTVPYTFGAYPQLAVNSASGTLQILTPSPSALFTIGITGTGNTAVQVNGTPFNDSNFQPTYIAANPLFGQTYVASGDGQVDILTKPSASPLQANLTLNGSDTATAGSSYYLRGLALYSQGDSSLIGATVTITATPAGGSPFTLASTTVGALAYPGGSVPSLSFTLPGVYTLVATVPATATHAAITSNTMSVTVGDTAKPYPGVYPTTLSLSVPATTSSTTVTAALTLAGSTYAPGGRIVINDASGTEVGRYTFTGAATAYPVQVSLTLPQGPSTLTAVYNGDDQNAGSASSPASITVGASSSLTTPTLALSVPTSATAGATLSGTVAFVSTTTDAPTDTISIYAVPAGTTTPITLATIPAAQAFTTAGKTFTFTAPAAGQYTLLAYYPGDSKYNTSQSNLGSLTVTAPAVATTVSLSGVTNQVAGTGFNLYVRLTNAQSTATPTGNITVRGGATNAVVATVSAAQALVSGGFGFPVTLSINGSYTFTASYPGDANFSPSTASLVVHVKATLALTNLYVPAGEVSGTKITGTLNTTLAPGLLPPTGTITIVATKVSSGAQTTLATIDAATTVTTPNISFQYLAPAPSGLYRVDANYSGDDNFVASSAPFINFNASDPTTIPTTLALSVPATYPPNAILDVGVQLGAPNAGTAVPSGNITVTVSKPGTTITQPSPVPAYLAFTSVCPCASVTLTDPGTYTITAVYAGDSKFSGSTQTGTVLIQRSTVAIHLTGPATTTTGAAATYNVALTGSITSPNAGILLSSKDASGANGPSGVVSGTSGSSVLTFLTAGTYTITANFAGDVSNQPATATLTTVVTGAPAAGFSMTLDNASTSSVNTELTSNTVVDVPFTIAALNGYSGTVVMDGSLTEIDGGQLSEDAFIYYLVDSNGNSVAGNLGIRAVSVTPTSTGLHLKVRMAGENAHSALRSPFERSRRLVLAGLFFGGGLLLWPRRRLSPRLLCLLLILCAIAGGGAVVSGCAASEGVLRVVVTARNPATNATQTISFPVHYTR
ncbi:beta strand repeat-containing protein [Terriglobus aquaticus]|uniref:Beta strand repeat-containing protein n=1 Tax=Terriglobus aquaticus TaxID=940139 RepID=A0ABW9KP00_9BACT|nr:hypothetical protein [Terriglobus aquaticus]